MKKNILKIKTREDKDLDHCVIKEIFIENIYSKKGFEIKPKDIVIDIGAHIGLFCLFASKQASNAKIYAFEPEKENFSLLKENIRSNEMKKVLAFNIAISSKKINELFVNKNSPGIHSIYPEWSKSNKKQKIKSKTLKEIFEENKIKTCNLMKIDCEGSEYNIIDNSSSNVLAKTDKIIIEYHNLNEKLNGNKIIEILLQNNFHQDIKVITEKTGIIYARKENSKNLYFNCLKMKINKIIGEKYFEINRKIGLVGIYLKNNHSRFYRFIQKIKGYGKERSNSNFSK